MKASHVGIAAPVEDHKSSRAPDKLCALSMFSELFIVLLMKKDPRLDQFDSKISTLLPKQLLPS